MLYIPLTTFSCAHISVVERGVATAEKGNAITHSVCLFAVTRHSLYPSLARSLARSLAVEFSCSIFSLSSRFHSSPVSGPRINTEKEREPSLSIRAIPYYTFTTIHALHFCCQWQWIWIEESKRGRGGKEEIHLGDPTKETRLNIISYSGAWCVFLTARYSHPPAIINPRPQEKRNFLYSFDFLLFFFLKKRGKGVNKPALGKRRLWSSCYRVSVKAPIRLILMISFHSI